LFVYSFMFIFLPNNHVRSEFLVAGKITKNAFATLKYPNESEKFQVSAKPMKLKKECKKKHRN